MRKAEASEMFFSLLRGYKFWRTAERLGRLNRVSRALPSISSKTSHASTSALSGCKSSFHFHFLLLVLECSMKTRGIPSV